MSEIMIIIAFAIGMIDHLSSSFLSRLEIFTAETAEILRSLLLSRVAMKS